jgi:hypothetical protein
VKWAQFTNCTFHELTPAITDLPGLLWIGAIKQQTGTQTCAALVRFAVACAKPDGTVPRQPLAVL